MGVYSTELFNNLGLCSYYAQQYDVAVDCFTRALELASDDEMADVWYNIGHLAVVSEYNPASDPGLIKRLMTPALTLMFSSGEPLCDCGVCVCVCVYVCVCVLYAEIM